jgi:hypothetical protein
MAMVDKNVKIRSGQEKFKRLKKEVDLMWA